MHKIFMAFFCLFISYTSFAQVTEPQKIITLNADTYLINELELDYKKQYGFIAKDIQDLFPALVKKKRINERFGKNVYRTKVIKVINEKALPNAIVSSLKGQNISAQQLKDKLIEIDKNS